MGDAEDQRVAIRITVRGVSQATLTRKPSCVFLLVEAVVPIKQRLVGPAAICLQFDAKAVAQVV